MTLQKNWEQTGGEPGRAEPAAGLSGPGTSLEPVGLERDGVTVSQCQKQ